MFLSILDRMESRIKSEGESFADRMRLFRRSLGFRHDNQFAEVLGISPQRLNAALKAGAFTRVLWQLLMARYPQAPRYWLEHGDEMQLTQKMVEDLARARLDRDKA